MNAKGVKKPPPKVKEQYGDIIVLSNENDYQSRPIKKFEEIALPQVFFDLFKKANYVEPTKIQSIAIPIALESYDIIGLAKTGSGKTLSFALPILMAIEDEKEYCKEQGTEYNNEMRPRAVVLVPTRELAIQVFESAEPYAKSLNQHIVCVYGGAKNSREQISELANGVDFLVATPGRLHDFINRGKIDLSEVFIFTLDEADRMLDMGFLPQVKAIVNHLKPERQTLLWSATWPQDVEELATDLCKNRPITIQVGDQGLTVNTAITQHVMVIPDADKKKELLKYMREHGGSGDFKVLIFSSTKKNCDFLAEFLTKEGFFAEAIHGDKDQMTRLKLLDDFKGSLNVLVATDVASRGLDIKNVKAVINFDFPNCIEDYVHRIGRTGRAGSTGESLSFFTDKDSNTAQDLCDFLRRANQEVPSELANMQGNGYKKQRYQRWDEADDKPFKDEERRPAGGDGGGFGGGKNQDDEDAGGWGGNNSGGGWGGNNSGDDGDDGGNRRGGRGGRGRGGGGGWGNRDNEGDGEDGGGFRGRGRGGFRGRGGGEKGDRDDRGGWGDREDRGDRGRGGRGGRGRGGGGSWGGDRDEQKQSSGGWGGDASTQDNKQSKGWGNSGDDDNDNDKGSGGWGNSKNTDSPATKPTSSWGRDNSNNDNANKAWGKGDSSPSRKGWGNGDSSPVRTGWGAASSTDNQNKRDKNPSPARNEKSWGAKESPAKNASKQWGTPIEEEEPKGWGK